MNKSVFYFYTHPESHLHLIFKCDSKVDNRKLKKRLIDNIAVRVFDKFLSKFKKELINFNGNFSQFKSFSLEIDEMVKSKSLLRNYEINPEIG
jgi:REP element-mobilizing transposase RayT